MLANALAELPDADHPARRVIQAHKTRERKRVQRLCTEAGFQDPSLGWVSVRAEMGSGGGVHASVIPSSSDAAQVLNGHLSGLDAHLANQHLPVHPVTISLSQESQFSSGPGDGNQREYGGHTNQNNQQASPDDRDTAGRSKSITTSLLRSDDQGSRELRILSASPLTPGGMYVSLMA